MKITSEEIKNELLHYYRFNRCYFVGTEVKVPFGIADILAVDREGNSSFEIEVKISISDLKKDFNYKTRKHSSYDKNNNQRRANYLYFCIPVELVKKAKEIIECQNDKYGIMVYDVESNCSVGEKIRVEKRAKKLNKSKNDYLFFRLFQRVNNELVTLYGKKYNGGNKGIQRSIK